MEVGWVNPGSDDARAQGCLCPVLDNNRGKWPPYPANDEHPEGGWFMTLDCPVHFPGGPS